MIWTKKLELKNNIKEPLILLHMDIGGQAVIEGVMMRSPHFYSVAVRKEDGKIDLKTERFISVSERFPLLKKPFLRGIVSMYEMLRLGIGALIHSGNVSEAKEDSISGSAVVGTVVFSFVFAIGLFLALPYALTLLIGISEEESTVLFNLVDGLIKAGLLIAYIWLISLWDDVARVFQYHGAEHKTVNAYESGKPLTARSAKGFSTAHSRCGTSFIVIVFLTMLILFSFVPSIAQASLPMERLNFLGQKAVLLAARFLFILPVVSVSYEILKLTDRRKENPLVKTLMWPGLAVQRLSTKEPDDKQLDVAVSAIKAVLSKEKSYPK